MKSSTERKTRRINDSDKGVDLLTKRQKDALDMQNGIDVSEGENDQSQEDGHASSAVLLGSNVAVRNAVRPIKLPEVKRLPPYTTWIFLDRFVKFIYYFQSLDLFYNAISQISLYYLIVSNAQTHGCMMCLLVVNQSDVESLGLYNTI